MEKVSDYFGSLVFNDRMMHERLPKDTYKALKQTINEGKDIDINIATVVANAMKDWALEHGATHFSHWFQPMTGITAEKHESFISSQRNGEVIMEFSGKELIKGEPDASSFPSGGLRATFEARGYTAWDPTSFAFLKEKTLFIPTAFCSYSGEVLDKKTPLLRSMEAISDQAVRVLHLLGKTEIKRVITTVGPEQEYFLIDKAQYQKRKDLIYTGRTLLGARPPKGQEMEDHYFGSLRPRVCAFMQELDEELWKLGVLAKTKHNEVAPSQHELAPIFTTTNIAVDHNQITMEMMRKVADRHGLVCLLHEKPFAGVNGSGKHNNWSIATDTGSNLLEPGDDVQFLLFLVAVIAAVDDYQDLLRVSVASAGNDHRLGANEAPPAIVSMYLGDELTEILEGIAKDKPTGTKAKRSMALGVHVLPDFPKDATDRNRTSPFAFTGNKFEFRMLGSSFSVAEPNIILNTSVAYELSLIADRLEHAANFNFELAALIKDTYIAHKRIVFNGNNYCPQWIEEAQTRGLLNLKSTVDALPAFVASKNIELFQKFRIFTSAEIHSRYEIMMENYNKTINIEALTLVDMVRRQILPATSRFTGKLAEAAREKRALLPDLACRMELDLISHLSALTDNLAQQIAHLDDGLVQARMIGDLTETGRFYRNEIVPTMSSTRAVADEIELLVGQDDWPYPTYGELLFTV
ncbi:MAG: glutamine synthetase III [Sphaerochaetaceae bacterium]